MTDSVNQIGKIVKEITNKANYALKRVIKKKYQIERVVDTFDTDNPFQMTFSMDKNLKTIYLDLYFKPPILATCCVGNTCSACEVFNTGANTVQLEKPYIPGSVTMRVNGRISTDLTETDPTTAMVDINLSIVAGTIVRLCYIYQI